MTPRASLLPEGSNGLFDPELAKSKNFRHPDAKWAILCDNSGKDFAQIGHILPAVHSPRTKTTSNSRQGANKMIDRPPLSVIHLPASVQEPGKAQTHRSAKHLTAPLGNTASAIGSVHPSYWPVHDNSSFRVLAVRSLGHEFRSGDPGPDSLLTNQARRERRTDPDRIPAGERFSQESNPLARLTEGESDLVEVKPAARAHDNIYARDRALVESLPHSVVRCDAHGRFLFANAAAMRMLGEAVADPIGKIPAEMGFDPDFCRSWHTNVQRVFAHGETLSLEFSVEIAGRSRILEMCLVPEYSMSGVISSALGIAHDITQHRQAELALRQKHDELEQRLHRYRHELQHLSAQLAASVQVKHEFLSTMSHELRTPLNAILVLSQIMLEGIRGPLNQHQRRAIQIITENGEHLLSMINDILDITKIRAGNFTLACAVHDVGRLCSSQITHLRANADKRSQVLDFVCPPAPLYLWVDRRRFDQIVCHLLENAIKFTPDGGRIALQIQPNLMRRTLRISVEDNGVGIVQDVIERIFEPFLQGDATLSRHYAGAGRGLTLVHHLVELHNGTITVESAGIPGMGSRFVVEFPWCAPPLNSPKDGAPD